MQSEAALHGGASTAVADHVVVLPDGSSRSFATAPTGMELAASISKGLAKAVVAIEVDGELRDLSRPIPSGAKVRLIKADDPQALALTRQRQGAAFALERRGRDVAVVEGFSPEVTAKLMDQIFKSTKTELKGPKP